MEAAPPVPQADSAALLRFGLFELDRAAGELRREGRVVRLQPQPFKILVLLATRSGQVVTREEIRREVWGEETFIDFDQGLGFCLTQIRAALGDSAQAPRYIQTLPRRGYRFLLPVEAEPRPVAARPRGVRPTALAAVLFAVAMGGALVAIHRGSIPVDVRTRAMVAVLPFEALGGSAPDDDLADGLTEEVIAEIGRTNPEGFGVIARSATIGYKGQRPEIARVGRELAVDYVLEGTIRREGARVRITSRLVRVRDRTQVWVASYDREQGDTLSLQRHVAVETAGGVRAALGSGRPLPPGRAVPGDLEVQQLVVRGQYFWNQRTAESFHRSLELFQEAARRNPDYAPAWSGIAQAWIGLGDYRHASPDEAAPRAREAVTRALALDPSLAEAHAVRAGVVGLFDRDWETARRELELAILLNPRYATAHQWLSHVLHSLGRTEEGLAQARKAFETDPVSVAISDNLADSLLVAGRPEEALAQVQRTMELDPRYAPAHVNRGRALLKLRRVDQALRAFDRAAALGTPCMVRAYRAVALVAAGRRAEARRALAGLEHGSPRHFERAMILSALGEAEAALAELDKSIEAGEPESRWILSDETLEPLRTHPRMAELARKLRLAS